MIHLSWILATIDPHSSVLFPCFFFSTNDILAFCVILVSEPSSLLFQGKAEGRRTALWFRARLQSQLFQLGCFLHSHAGKVLFVAVLVLSTFCVGLKSAVIHSRAEQLWVEGESLNNTMHLPLETFELLQCVFKFPVVSFKLVFSSKTVKKQSFRIRFKSPHSIF